MGKKFIELNKKADGSSSYLNLESIDQIHVESFVEFDEALQGQQHFRARGITNQGETHILVQDSRSDKPDVVMQWVTENLLKIKKFLEVNRKDNGAVSFVDINSFDQVHIEQYVEVDEKLEGKKHFRAVGINHLGQAVILFKDNKSPKADDVRRWIKDNVLKTK